MKRVELKHVVDYIKNYKKIDSIFRVDDTVLKIVFDRNSVIFFDMTKGSSYIFKKESYKVSKIYNAPFDVVLKKRCNGALISNIELLDGNKIIRFELFLKKSYKATRSFLQFEFTGRHTNIIITDEDLVIMEALRHIDKSVSYREIQCGLKLPVLPPIEHKEEDILIDDIDKYLYESYSLKEKKRLIQIKNQKLIATQKKIEKLIKIKSTLLKPEQLSDKAKTYQKEAKLILSNIHNLKNYQKEVELLDFEGKRVKIILPKEARTPAEAANTLFALSKKLKQKSKHIHIEKENLNSKIKYLESLKNIIKNAQSIDELNLYFPRKKQAGKKEKKYDAVENFYYEGYKISLGKNEKANAYLLKNAKMSDLWMHLKNIPSTHVIIRSDKKEIPKSVIEFGAQLCVKFSTTQENSFLVDFTKRRNVKVVKDAKVNYVNYDTIKIKN